MSRTQVGTRLLGAGSVLQVVYNSSAAAISGSVAMPDSTVWTQSHGTEVITATITPKSATSILLVDATIHISRAAEARVYVGLFRDSGNVISYTEQYDNSFINTNGRIMHHVISGSVSPTTFKVRAGPSSAQSVSYGLVNGPSGAPTVYIRITEIAA